MTCLISDLDQQPLDVAGLYTRDSELDVAAIHAIFALVTLISALRDVLGAVCRNAWKANPPGPSGLTDVPDMKEFFQFAWSSRKHVMRKRRWPRVEKWQEDYLPTGVVREGRDRYCTKGRQLFKLLRA